MAKEIRITPEIQFKPKYDGVFMDDNTYRDYVYKARMFESNEEAQSRLENDFDALKESCETRFIPEYMWIGLGFVAGFIIAR